MDWLKQRLSTRPDLAESLRAEAQAGNIVDAVIVADNGKFHLEVYPSDTLKAEQLKRLNERLADAIGTKIDLAVALPRFPGSSGPKPTQ
jgi:hypothetical protein